MKRQSAEVPDGMKRCGGRVLGLGEFYRNRAARDGRQSSCRTCMLARVRAYQARNRERVLSGHRKSMAKRNAAGKDQAKAFGITPEQYLEIKNSPCALEGPNCKGRIGVDHDHSCCPEGARSCGWCIRGPLCLAHNLNVGSYEKYVIGPEHPMFKEILHYLNELAYPRGFLKR